MSVEYMFYTLFFIMETCGKKTQNTFEFYPSFCIFAAKIK